MRSTTRLPAHSDYAELLGSVFEFMLIAGLQKAEIAQTIANALSRAEKDSSRARTRRAGLATAALILDAWHRNRRYLTNNGRPKPVKLYGSAPSVEALVRSEYPGSDSAEVTRRLLSLGLVARVGARLYEPTSSVAVVSGLDPLMQQHAARSSATLLATIKYNVRKRHPSERLIERIAEVPDLPIQWADQFRKFTGEQGAVLLNTVNDWLESRRARRASKSRSTTRAGIHVYAYIEPRSTKQRRRSATP